MMMGTMKNALKFVVVAGLAVGAVGGMAGTVVAGDHLRDALWAIDSVGLVVATAILSISFFRKGCDAVAAGFLVFALGEAVMLGGTAASLEASVPAFAAGTALWAAGLLLTSVPGELAAWVRGAGIVAALLFAVTSGSLFRGDAVTPLSRPLPFFGYPFLVLTFAGWIWTAVKAN